MVKSKWILSQLRMVNDMLLESQANIDSVRQNDFPINSSFYRMILFQYLIVATKIKFQLFSVCIPGRVRGFLLSWFFLKL